MTADEFDGGSSVPPDPSAQEVSTGLRALGRRRPFRLGMAVGMVAALGAALLVIQNGQSVRVEWLWLDLDLPQWVLLTTTLAIGAFVGQIGRVAAIRSRARAADRRTIVRSARRRLRGR